LYCTRRWVEHSRSGYVNVWVLSDVVTVAVVVIELFFQVLQMYDCRRSNMLNACLMVIQYIQ
jgi:hypothetical protein